MHPITKRTIRFWNKDNVKPVFSWIQNAVQRKEKENREGKSDEGKNEQKKGRLWFMLNENNFQVAESWKGYRKVYGTNKVERVLYEILILFIYFSWDDMKTRITMNPSWIKGGNPNTRGEKLIRSHSNESEWLRMSE
jgi:hypothetical protein